jgi:hypothetical protein
MADNIEKAVLNYLLADANIAASVSTRIHLFTRPQGSSLPAVVISHTTGGPLYADDGEVGLFNVRLQIDSWALSYGDAKDLASSVMTRLSAVRDVNQSGVTLKYIMHDKEKDFREGDFSYEYKIMQEYIIVYGV